MAQRMLKEQLLSLNYEQKIKLREWWKPKAMDSFLYQQIDGSLKVGKVIKGREPEDKDKFLPLPTNKQIIQLLEEEFTVMINDSINKCTIRLVESDNSNQYIDIEDKEIGDALFKTLKQVL